MQINSHYWFQDSDERYPGHTRGYLANPTSMPGQAASVPTFTTWSCSHPIYISELTKEFPRYKLWRIHDHLCVKSKPPCPTTSPMLQASVQAPGTGDRLQMLTVQDDRRHATRILRGCMTNYSERCTAGCCRPQARVSSNHGLSIGSRRAGVLRRQPSAGPVVVPSFSKQPFEAS